MNKKLIRSKSLLPTIITILSLGVILCFGYREYVNKIKIPSQNLPVSSEIPNYQGDSFSSTILEYWKNYKNSQMGFIMKIPPAWFVHTSKENFGGYFMNISYPVDNPSSQDFIVGQTAEMSVSVGLSDGTTALEEAQKRIHDYGMDNSTAKLQKITIDNELGYIYSYGDNGVEITVHHNNYVYFIWFFTDPAAMKQFSPTLGSMLSTIRFIELDKLGRPCGGAGFDIGKNQCDQGFSCKLIQESDSKEPKGICVKSK